MKNTFSNKIVWITGASSGIGEALVYAFLLEGAKVILSSRNQAELNRVVRNCSDLKENAYEYPMDVTDNIQVFNTVEQVIDRFGRVDILVNNSGISQRSLVKETPVEVDRKIMEVNFFGAVTLTKYLIPHMIINGGGHIVVTSSIVGKFGFPLRSAYSASKHALHGFFESLRLELYDNNINVLMVIPGQVRTNISFNAITKDGSPNGVMDHGQEGGISPDVVADAVLKGLRCKKREILVGRKEILMVHIRRFFPALFFKIARKVRKT